MYDSNNNNDDNNNNKASVRDTPTYQFSRYKIQINNFCFIGVWMKARQFAARY
jgi:hypothetical protein